MDLFEKVRDLLGCEYISDICRERFLCSARRVVAALDLTPYSARELADMAEYLYRRKMYDEEKTIIMAYLKNVA